MSSYTKCLSEMEEYSDPNSTTTKFSHLDNASLGWFHLRAVIVSGVGFFADAYDIFAIQLALPMIYQVYYPNPANPNNATSFTKDHSHIDGWVKASTNWGNLIGQLAFGYLGDKLGRKKMYGVELIIMIVSTFGSAISAPAKYGFDILIIFSLWRFILGIGIGGDYPMSCVITSEFATVKHRGLMIAAVFSLQGVGILFGGIVMVSTLALMEPLIRANPDVLDIVWRIILGFGVLPALIAVYFRMTIPETPRYTVDVIGDHEKAERDIEKVLILNQEANVTSNVQQTTPLVRHTFTPTKKQVTFWEYFGTWKYGKVLFGTAYCWFALDVAWYGLSLNQTRILKIINFNGSNSGPIYDSFFQKGLGQLIIACMGTVPGYFVTVGLVEVLGRKPIQYLGFFVITSILAILALAFEQIVCHQALFITLFTIANFFFNFGPNQTTFIIPGEVFPTRFRSTAHGISAAAGKFGAIIGIQLIAPYFETSPSVVLGIFALIMFTGGLATALIPETKGKTLEELSGENEMHELLSPQKQTL